MVKSDMKKLNGFAGNTLRVNLTNKKITKKPLEKEIVQKFLGGVGYAAQLLWKELEPGIDPLGPKNKIVITTGPLTGTLCPGSGSWEACFKSPLTNVWGESRCGGGLGPELKYAGFDIVILEGKSKDPVYLWIHDGEAEIRSAEHLNHKTVPETEDSLKEELGEYKARVACIGPAGENLVRFASIMADYDRAAGRCGGGAVLGSKNLKAIVVRGHGEIPIGDYEAYLLAAQEAEKTLAEHPWRPAFGGGTISFLPSIDARGDLPTKYGASNFWGKGGDTYHTFDEKYSRGFKACFGCGIGCNIYSEVTGGKWATPLYGGPEYETTGVFTALMLNEDIEALIRANYLCDIYGLDTISCGNLIAFAMECYERGWLTEKETDGLPLKYGDMDVVMELIRKIALCDGFGATLAEGVRAAAEKIGKGAPEIALHVKGLEMPAHDPRSAKNMTLDYGTANIGMSHIHPFECWVYTKYGLDVGELQQYDLGLPVPPPGEYDEKGIAPVTKVYQDFGMLQDILGTCRFPAYVNMTLKRYTALTSALLGWKIDERELIRIGERVFNLQRCLNVREGIRRKDDYIPKILCRAPASGAYSYGELGEQSAITDNETMLDEYYEARGWDKSTGIPTQKKLKELQLDNVAEEIKRYTQSKR